MGESPFPTAHAAIDKHHNSLWDAVALLDAAQDRIDELTPSTHDDERMAGALHNTGRLVRLAMEKVEAAAEAFSNILPESRT